MPTPPTRNPAKPRRKKTAKLQALPLRLEPGFEWLEPLLLLMVKKPRSYVSTPDAARFIGCSHSQVITAIQTGALAAHHNGLTPTGNGHWQIHPVSLLRFVWERRGSTEHGTPPNAAYLLCHVLCHALSRPGKLALRTLLDALMQRDERAAQGLQLGAVDRHTADLLLQSAAATRPAATTRTTQPDQPSLL